MAALAARQPEHCRLSLSRAAARRAHLHGSPCGSSADPARRRLLRYGPESRCQLPTPTGGDRASLPDGGPGNGPFEEAIADRSEEHTSELQSLMRISYAVFCLKKKKQHKKI